MQPTCARTVIRQGGRDAGISIVGLFGGNFDSMEGRRQLNCYMPLRLDMDATRTAHGTEYVRENGDVALKFMRQVYDDNPHLTESALARAVCGAS